jgi:hypothetical protein
MLGWMQAGAWALLRLDRLRGTELDIGRLFVREDQSLPAIATTRTLCLVAWMVIVGLFGISAWAKDTSARLHAIELRFELTTTSQHDVAGCLVHAAKPGHPCCGIACCPTFAVLSPPAYERSRPRFTPTPCPATHYTSLAPEVLPPPPKGALAAL